MNNQLNNKSVDEIFLTSRHVILKVNVTVCILVYPKHNFNPQSLIVYVVNAFCVK